MLVQSMPWEQRFVIGSVVVSSVLGFWMWSKEDVQTVLESVVLKYLVGYYWGFFSILGILSIFQVQCSLLWSFSTNLIQLFYPDSSKQLWAVFPYTAEYPSYDCVSKNILLWELKCCLYIICQYILQWEESRACIFIYGTAYLANNYNVRVIISVLPVCVNNTLPVKLILYSERFESSRAVLSW